jgi:REG-2-like HAD superfamily hydrolase
VRRPDFVYFDAGYTLLRVAGSVGAQYAAVARAFGSDADGGALDGAFVAAWRHCRRHRAAHPAIAYGLNEAEARWFWAGVVEETFRLAGAVLPDDPRFQPVLFDHFARPEVWELYPDVAEALAMLEASGIGWGILSNWDGRLRSVIGELRPAALVISSEAGAEKPDPLIFRAAEQAARGATRLALVGDEPEADGHGALRAGWGQCLVWRSGADPPPGLDSAPDLTGAVARLLG